MKTTNKTHYVYKITNLNPTSSEYLYIGVHSDKNPNPLNDGYMETSKYLDKAMKTEGIINFNKEILSLWNTRKEAVQEEIRVHELFDVAVNPNYYNRSKQKAVGFDVTGCDAHTREPMGKKNIGMVSVFDTITKKT